MKVKRRSFLGATIVVAPLASVVGVTAARQVEQLKAIPLARAPKGIEWLTLSEVKLASEARKSALGRYAGPLTEPLLLEAIQDCGFPARLVLLSMGGVEDYVKALASERRYSSYSSNDGPGTHMPAHDGLLVIVEPAVEVELQCHLAMPEGTIALST